MGRLPCSREVRNRDGMTEIYGPAFYDHLLVEVPRSARAIVPLVMSLMAPRSVVDIGCGNGAWLAAFSEAGVRDFLGVDGAYTPPERLLMPHDRFRAVDIAQPFDLGRRFDLAISLEVAEHLPASAADRFVETLTKLAPVIMFSAAVPSQGGVGHVNEQWQDYWRAKFAAHGLLATDPIRPLIWGRAEVAAYYQQNIIVYIAADRVADYPGLTVLAPEHSLNLAHHTLVDRHITTEPTLGNILRILPRVVRKSAAYHLRRLLGWRTPDH